MERASERASERARERERESSPNSPWSRPRQPIGSVGRKAGTKPTTLPPRPPSIPVFSPLDTCRYHRAAAASSLGTPLPLRRTAARRLIARPSPPSAARRTHSTDSASSGASARCLPPPPATWSRVLTLRLQAVACDSTRSDWRYWQCGEPGIFRRVTGGTPIWLLATRTATGWAAGEPCSAHSRCHSRPWSSHLALSKNQRTVARGSGDGGDGGGGTRAGGWRRAAVQPVRFGD